MSEISNVSSSEVFNPIQDENLEAIVNEKKEAKEVEVKQPVVAKADVVAEQVIAQVVAKKALPALKLKDIKLKDVKKRDADLAQRHVTSNAKDIKFDAARGVVVLSKSGQFRAYQIGNGTGPALIESERRSEVTAFLDRM